MTDDDTGGKRRTVGFAVGASGVLMLFVALLVYGGVIEVSEQARPLVAGILGVVAALDLSLAVYFIASDPS